jgi:NADPH:quinone reductase-like Zn-dependent oxidoreductase
VLTVVSLPDPAPGPAPVAIDVTHAAVRAHRYLLPPGSVQGPARDAAAPFVPRLEVAGTVRELGEVAGNASGDWDQQIDSNRVWLGGFTVSGFNAEAYVSAHPQELGPAAEAALRAIAAGLADTGIEVLPFAEAVTAHERMESRALNGRIVLSPQ